MEHDSRHDYIREHYRPDLRADTIQNVGVLGAMAHDGNRHQRRHAIRILMSMPDMRGWARRNAYWCSRDGCEKCVHNHKNHRLAMKRLGLILVPQE